jgi:hypothetical protein
LRKEAGTVPAIETETEGANQVTIGRRLGAALSLCKELCSSRFCEGSLRGCLEQRSSTSEECARTKFLVISSGVMPMPLSVTLLLSVIECFR